MTTATDIGAGAAPEAARAATDLQPEHPPSVVLPPRRRSRWRFVWFALLLAILLLAGPYVLGLAYALIPPPVSTLMLWQAVDGNAIDYRWRPIEQISPHLVKAVVTSEDARICQHNGVDWEVLNELIEQAAETGEPVRGGSTIPMQTAKNLFLWPSRSYVRKALEIPLAYWLDFVWSKRRMAEVYVNIAEWAPGVYGAEAAARHHFKKSAAEITPREAALLAAALPDPDGRKPGKPGPTTKKAANRIAKRVPGTVSYLDCLGIELPPAESVAR